MSETVKNIGLSFPKTKRTSSNVFIFPQTKHIQSWGQMRFLKNYKRHNWLSKELKINVKLTKLMNKFVQPLSLLWISVLGLLWDLIHQMSHWHAHFISQEAKETLTLLALSKQLSKAQKYSVNYYIWQRTAGHHHISAASVKECLALVLEESTNCLSSMCFHFFLKLKRYYWRICLHLHWLLINMCKFSIKGDVSKIPTHKHHSLKTKSHCLLFYKQHLHRP